MLSCLCLVFLSVFYHRICFAADVIGKISHVSDLVVVQSMYQTAGSNTRTVILTDLLGAELRIVLWGDQAVEFDADAVRAMSDKEPVIAIFVGTLPKSHHGVTGLSGSSACRWYIDEDIPDVNSFRASLGGQFTPLTAYISTGPDALPTHVYADPIEMTMKELNGVDPFVDMDKRFICSVTVDIICGWWFASCKRFHKSAKHDGCQYQCSGATCDSVKADLAYCVSVFASDDTGGAEFVMFDKVGAAAVRKQLMPLMRQSIYDAIGQHDISVPYVGGKRGYKYLSRYGAIALSLSPHETVPISNIAGVISWRKQFTLDGLPVPQSQLYQLSSKTGKDIY
ncbi:uncharacterized protein LOC124703781 isoform X4 [Lolium rigidum]|uniref:uncharacterized protein LOC124703781 isoform X4 n=1 Tax=Lolium rigidum TaxID=89674 RepID=UPI001F5DFEF6|nr:uncharacterized protein LOC124703781 isoform X4 [Lolium rigidum]